MRIYFKICLKFSKFLANLLIVLVYMLRHIYIDILYCVIYVDVKTYTYI